MDACKVLPADIIVLIMVLHRIILNMVHYRIILIMVVHHRITLIMARYLIEQSGRDLDHRCTPVVVTVVGCLDPLLDPAHDVLLLRTSCGNIPS